MPTKKSRAELMREIDAEYYGYLDDDDNLLVVQEETCEKVARRQKIEEFKKKTKTEEMETDALDEVDSEEKKLSVIIILT